MIEIIEETFEEFMNRNTYDLELHRTLYYEYCGLIGRDVDENISKAVNLIFMSVPLLAKTNCEYVKNQLNVIQETETDETLIFALRTVLLLGWEKIEKENIKDVRTKEIKAAPLN